MSEEAAAPNYDVGYGRPPMQSRFKKGRSGNPSGRPRGARNLETRMMEALEARVTVVENGRSVKRSKFELMLVQLSNRAAKGDLRAADMVLRLMQRFEQAAAPASETPAGESPTYGTAEDDQYFASVLARFKEGEKEP